MGGSISRREIAIAITSVHKHAQEFTDVRQRVQVASLHKTCARVARVLRVNKGKIPVEACPGVSSCVLELRNSNRLPLSFNVLSCWLSLRAQDNNKTRRNTTRSEEEEEERRHEFRTGNGGPGKAILFQPCGAVRFCGIISGDPAGEVFDFGGLFVEVIKTQVFAVASISTLAWKKGAVNPTLACADRKRH